VDLHMTVIPRMRRADAPRSKIKATQVRSWRHDRPRRSSPRLPTPDQDGEPVRLSALRGHTVVLYLARGRGGTLGTAQVPGVDRVFDERQERAALHRVSECARSSAVHSLPKRAWHAEAAL
jgi:hypothetical protein